MMKYISIETANDGKLLIPIGTGLLVRRESAVKVSFFNGDSLGMGYEGADKVGLKLTGTGFTQALVDNINAAIVESLQSNYRAKPVAVKIPSGNAVNDFDVST